MLNNGLARRVRKNPRLRPIGIAGYRLYARLRPAGDGPKLLANSIPKAGTHVLMSLLDAIPGMRFSGIHFAVTGATRPGGINELRELETLVNRLRPSHYMTGHIRHHPDTLAVLAQAQCRTIVSIRDPRAIALSAANYMRTNERHPLHARGLTELPELDDRLTAVIHGLAPSDTGPGFPSLAERLDRFLPWLDESGVFILRYEDLIGPQGGGSIERQRSLVIDILDFLGLPAEADVVEQVANSIYSTKSATFRRGQIDSWRDEMSPHHVELINELCKEQMLRLGYSSTGNEWPE